MPYFISVILHMNCPPPRHPEGKHHTPHGWSVFTPTFLSGNSHSYIPSCCGGCGRHQTSWGAARPEISWGSMVGQLRGVASSPWVRVSTHKWLYLVGPLALPFFFEYVFPLLICMLSRRFCVPWHPIGSLSFASPPSFLIGLFIVSLHPPHTLALTGLDFVALFTPCTSPYIIVEPSAFKVFHFCTLPGINCRNSMWETPPAPLFLIGSSETASVCVPPLHQWLRALARMPSWSCPCAPDGGWRLWESWILMWDIRGRCSVLASDTKARLHHPAAWFCLFDFSCHKRLAVLSCIPFYLLGKRLIGGQCFHGLTSQPKEILHFKSSIYFCFSPFLNWQSSGSYKKLFTLEAITSSSNVVAFVQCSYTHCM